MPILGPDLPTTITEWLPRPNIKFPTGRLGLRGDPSRRALLDWGRNRERSFLEDALENPPELSAFKSQSPFLLRLHQRSLQQFEEPAGRPVRKARRAVARRRASLLGRAESTQSTVLG